MPLSHDPSRVDPRGLRFAAWVTTAVLVAVLVSGSAVLLGLQALVFALGAFAGIRRSPYSAVYRTVVAPRLSPTTEREPAAPVRFTQASASRSRSSAPSDTPPGFPSSVPRRPRWSSARPSSMPRSDSASAARSTSGCPHACAVADRPHRPHCTPPGNKELPHDP